MVIIVKQSINFHSIFISEHQGLNMDSKLEKRITILFFIKRKTLNEKQTSICNNIFIKLQHFFKGYLYSKQYSQLVALFIKNNYKC